jgi:hypothetical protein
MFKNINARRRMKKAHVPNRTCHKREGSRGDLQGQKSAFSRMVTGGTCFVTEVGVKGKIRIQDEL